MAILTMYCSRKREKENDVCLPEVSISSSVFTKGLQGETFLRLWNEWDPKVWWTSVKQFYVRSRLWNDNLPQIRPCFYQQQRQLAKNNIPEPCSTILEEVQTKIVIFGLINFKIKGFLVEVREGAVQKVFWEPSCYFVQFDLNNPKMLNLRKS